MPLHLSIENETALPDGGPVSITVTARRGVDIGRDQYLDWVLPDPTRMVSGKHAEIRFRDGQYWLTDVSTNGTFVNRSEFRLAGPYALKTGDMIEIGKYVIGVRIEPEAGAGNGGMTDPHAGASAPANLWDAGGEAAPAINPRELRAPSNSGGIGSSDILDWAAGIPVPAAPQYAPPPLQAAAPPPSLDWLAEPEPIAMPRPGRPAPQPEHAAMRAAPEPAPYPPPPAPAAPMPFAPVPAAPMPFAPMPSAPMPSAPVPAAPFPAPPAQAAPPMPPAPSAAPAPQPVFTTRTGYAAGFAWDIEKADPAASSASKTQPPGWDLPPPQQQPSAPSAWDEHPAPRPVDERPAPQPAAATFGEARPQPQPPMPAPPMPAATPFPLSADAFIERFARGLGVPADIIQGRRSDELAELAGGMLRATIENLRQLQAARTQSKGVMRSSSHTMIQATDNNALRFSPSAEEALRLMFGPPTRSYLPPRETIEASFQDLKTHQMKMLSAMQTALGALLNDLDPARIEARMDDDKGLGGLLQSRKAKQWEHYKTLWNAKVGKNEQGMLGVFMILFADAYDRSGS